jgi:RNA polymerase sigma factor (TIGR02999 family)
MAMRELSRERPCHTLDPSALVGEVYIKLTGNGDIEWLGKAHFFAIAARAMRAILVDYARARAAAKRGGGVPLVTFDRVAEAIAVERPEHVLALDAALDRLAQVNAEAAGMIEYRYFAGMSYREVGELLGQTEATVRRRCAFARAWLRDELSGDANR